MANFRTKEENPSSLNLTPPLTWEEPAYERLKVLYGISKLLSYFENVETTFPQILSLCSKAFPLVSAVLIEKRGNKISSTTWHADNVSKEQAAHAAAYANKSFAFFIGTAESVNSTLQSKSTALIELESIQTDPSDEPPNPNNYVVLPLIVDKLPAFGVFQLEGNGLLNEKDLGFVDALANLIAVAVDRHYHIEYRRELQERETKESSFKLSRTQAHVDDLEIEKQLRESFVSLLTHDLRTPLSAISMSAQLIQRQSDSSPSSVGLAARIVSSVNRADQMISDLLDANRIRSGEPLPLNFESFDLCTLAKETLDELATAHGDRFVLKSCEIVEGHWDRRYLRRILENLCNNAIKYGDPYAPISLSISKQSPDAIVQVHNVGEPISLSDQKSLFDQFRRTQGAKVSRKKGWGIGLTLVRGVAEAHGGNVKVESEKTTGTIFTLRIPIDSRPHLPKEKT